MDQAELSRHELSITDSGRGYLLSTEIGWNQTRADWSYMLANGPGLGLTDTNGKLVASEPANIEIIVRRDIERENITITQAPQ